MVVIGAILAIIGAPLSFVGALILYLVIDAVVKSSRRGTGS